MTLLKSSLYFITFRDLKAWLTALAYCASECPNSNPFLAKKNEKASAVEVSPFRSFHSLGSRASKAVRLSVVDQKASRAGILFGIFTLSFVWVG